MVKPPVPPDAACRFDHQSRRSDRPSEAGGGGSGRRSRASRIDSRASERRSEGVFPPAPPGGPSPVPPSPSRPPRVRGHPDRPRGAGVGVRRPSWRSSGGSGSPLRSGIVGAAAVAVGQGGFGRLKTLGEGSILDGVAPDAVEGIADNPGREAGVRNVPAPRGSPDARPPRSPGHSRSSSGGPGRPSGRRRGSGRGPPHSGRADKGPPRGCRARSDCPAIVPPPNGMPPGPPRNLPSGTLPDPARRPPSRSSQRRRRRWPRG